MADEAHVRIGLRNTDVASAALLTAIVIASVFLRFWNLPNQAWLDVEDVQQVGYARDLVERGFLGNGAAYVMWTVMGAAAQVVFGKGPYGEMLVSASLGSTTVLILYVLGTQWHSRATGIAAAVLIGGSLNHVHFSRWAQPQAAALFFVLLGYVLYNRALRGDRSSGKIFVAGATAGLGLLCHLSLIGLAAALMVAEGLREPRLSWKMVRRLSLIISALAAPLLLAETVVRLLRVAAGNPRIGSPIGHIWLTPHYVGFSGGMAQSIQISHPLFFWQHLLNAEGLTFVLAALTGWIGLTIALFRRGSGKGTWWLPWVFVTAGYTSTVLYSLSTGFRIYRYIVPLVPGSVLAAAILVGAGACGLRARAGKRWEAAALALFCAVWMTFGVMRARPRISFNTGFQDVWSAVRNSGARRIAFVGDPDSDNYWEKSRWSILTTYFPHETVTVNRLKDISDLRPPPQLVVVGMDYDGEQPVAGTFRAVAASVPIRMPGYDEQPTGRWRPNLMVFVLRE